MPYRLKSNRSPAGAAIFTKPALTMLMGQATNNSQRAEVVRLWFENGHGPCDVTSGSKSEMGALQRRYHIRKILGEQGFDAQCKTEVGFDGDEVSVKQIVVALREVLPKGEVHYYADTSTPTALVEPHRLSGRPRL